MKKSNEEPFGIRLAWRDAHGEPDGIVRSLPAAYTDRSLPGFSLSRSRPGMSLRSRRSLVLPAEAVGGGPNPVAVVGSSGSVPAACGGPSARRRVGAVPFGEV